MKKVKEQLEKWHQSEGGEMWQVERLVSRMRDFEIDHEPDGWPAVKMRDISKLCDAIENAVPSLDLLQSRLETKAEINFQDGRWCLFDNDGEVICSGITIRDMMINLIFTDC